MNFLWSFLSAVIKAVVWKLCNLPRKFTSISSSPLHPSYAFPLRPGAILSVSPRVVWPPQPSGSWRPVRGERCLLHRPVADALGCAGPEWCGDATSRPRSVAATGWRVSPCWSAFPCQQVLQAGCWTSPWGTGWSMWGCLSTRASCCWTALTTCTTWWVPDSTAAVFCLCHNSCNIPS